MPADLQLQLKKHIQVFLAEKAFIGCGGLAMTDDIRVTVAAQALWCSNSPAARTRPAGMRQAFSRITRGIILLFILFIHFL